MGQVEKEQTGQALLVLLAWRFAPPRKAKIM